MKGGEERRREERRGWREFVLCPRKKKEKLAPMRPSVGRGRLTTRQDSLVCGCSITTNNVLPGILTTTIGVPSSRTASGARSRDDDVTARSRDRRRVGGASEASAATLRSRTTSITASISCTSTSLPAAAAAASRSSSRSSSSSAGWRSSMSRWRRGRLHSAGCRACQVNMCSVHRNSMERKRAENRNKWHNKFISVNCNRQYAFSALKLLVRRQEG